MGGLRVGTRVDVHVFLDGGNEMGIVRFVGGCRRCEGVERGWWLCGKRHKTKKRYLGR